MLYSIVLGSAMHHNESVTNMYVYSSLPSWTSLPSPPLPHSSRLSQSTGLSSLCYTANSHWLSILHMVINTCLCYSLSSFHPLPPMDTEIVVHIYNGYLHTQKECLWVLMRWMNLEPMYRVKSVRKRKTNIVH